MSRSRPPKVAQDGFTIVELMIATVVFSVILVVITSGIIHFTESYYKGLHQSSTQTTARTVMNTIAQNLQYGGGGNTFVTNADDMSTPDKYICIGTVQINYKLGPQLGTDGTYGVFVTSKDPVNGCLPFQASKPGKELLGPKMRLTNLSITQGAGGAQSLYTVSAGVAYGDIDLLCSSAITPNTTADGGCAPNAGVFPANYSIWANATNGPKINCRGGSGSQFCAASHLSTQVVARFESTSP